MSDNYHFDLNGETRERFEAAMSFAFSEHAKAYGYRVTPKGLVFYWACDQESGVLPLPYPMKLDAAIGFAWHWLESAVYGPQPDHDGSNHKGWRVYNEAWGHIDGEWRAFAAIQPEWMMYGK